MTLDWFILNMVSCPNCASTLTAEPIPNEWENVFCTNCPFVCRFITVNQEPNESKLHILPDNLKKILIDNTLLPPLIIDYKWTNQNIKWEKVIFFPFISSKFLKEQQEHPVSLIPDEEATILFEIQKLPSVVLYEQPSEEEMAELVYDWDRISASGIQRKFYIGYSKAARIKDIAMKLRKERGIVELGEDEGEEE